MNCIGPDHAGPIDVQIFVIPSVQDFNRWAGATGIVVRCSGCGGTFRSVGLPRFEKPDLPQGFPGYRFTYDPKNPSAATIEFRTPASFMKPGELDVIFGPEG